MRHAESNAWILRDQIALVRDEAETRERVNYK
jgi:hypothetical protein